MKPMSVRTVPDPLCHRHAICRRLRPPGDLRVVRRRAGAPPRPAALPWPRNASPRGSTSGSTSARRSDATPGPYAKLRRNARLPGARGRQPDRACKEVFRVNQQRVSLDELEQRDEFSQRHIGPSPDEQVKMLAELGLASLDELLDQTVPVAIRLGPQALGLPSGTTERAASARLREMAARNQVFTSLIGLGYHGTVTPPVIQRNVLEDPAWYTAYTPYQPEIAQGRLEALLNFQTMVADLTGMELANASLLDEGSAAAEAMAMSRRLAGRERDGQREGGAFFVDADCHPQTIAVLLARAGPLGVPVVVGDPQADLDPDARPVLGVLLQYPGSGGAVRDLRPVIERAHAAGALATVAADLLALVRLAPPGKLGADVVVGSSQRFGVPMWFGGPHAAYMATREAYARSLPGGWSGCPPTRRGGPPCGWRCRPASSTSAASGRPATSAPPRYCSRSSRACTRSGTARTVCVRSPSGSTGSPPSLPRACARASATRSRWRTAPGSTR